MLFAGWLDANITGLINGNYRQVTFMSFKTHRSGKSAKKSEADNLSVIVNWIIQTFPRFLTFSLSFSFYPLLFWAPCHVLITP